MLNHLKLNHYNIYILGISMMFIGLPFSNFLMSLSQIVLVVNWLIEGKFKLKWNLFCENRTAQIVASLFIMYIIGLIYSTDLTYAFNELRIKLPIFLLLQNLN